MGFIGAFGFSVRDHLAHGNDALSDCLVDFIRIGGNVSNDLFLPIISLPCLLQLSLLFLFNLLHNEVVDNVEK